VLKKAGLAEIIVVTGFNRTALEAELGNLGVRAVHNPRYGEGEMLSSIQAGLRAVSAAADAALIALGDQPAIEAEVVGALVGAFRDNKGGVIIPSYNRKRGHPILIGREHWSGILDLKHDQTMRDFLKNEKIIYHVNVSYKSVLRDMDTADDYERELMLLKASHPDNPQS
jgi:molybdenum cofactor cytidylyltransferase